MAAFHLAQVVAACGAAFQVEAVAPPSALLADRHPGAKRGPLGTADFQSTVTLGSELDRVDVGDRRITATAGVVVRARLREAALPARAMVNTDRDGIGGPGGECLLGGQAAEHDTDDAVTRDVSVVP
ncbi:hypothetical protein [Actinomadura sp. NPDC049753]|uniref:hypothetical protein n=1 Tax=Actinomadura sp. NPDC049753 TaxID=3154739 RepID=UPI00343206A1